MLLRILTFFKWVYGNPLTFLVGIRRIPAYHVDYTTGYQGLLRGNKLVAHCCCSAGTPKIIPASAAVSHWQHSNATRIIHSRVLSREHRAELEFRRGIAANNNNYTHSRRFRQNASHLHVLLILELTHALSMSARPQIAIRRVTAFNNYKGS